MDTWPQRDRIVHGDDGAHEVADPELSPGRKRTRSGKEVAAVGVVRQRDPLGPRPGINVRIPILSNFRSTSTQNWLFFAKKKQC
jgi:hypothetical protein